METDSRKTNATVMLPETGDSAVSRNHRLGSEVIKCRRGEDETF